MAKLHRHVNRHTKDFDLFWDRFADELVFHPAEYPDGSFDSRLMMLQDLQLNPTVAHNYRSGNTKILWQAIQDNDDEYDPEPPNPYDVLSQ